MRYRTQSANVLNEADRMGRILDFQLFCMEQESKLWGYNEAVDWIPGDPIYQHPKEVERDSCSCCHDDNELEGYYGNHVRPMFEIFDDGDRYPSLRCKDCEVSWMGKEAACWICGNECPVPAMQTSWGHILWSHQTHEFDVDSLRTQIEEGLRLEIGDRWRRQMAERMNAFSIGMETMTDSLGAFSIRMREITEIRGFRSHIVLYDEVQSVSPYIPPPPPANPFEASERKIELIPPVVADLTTPVRGRVRLPADVDLSGRVEPPMPQMPEPRNFSGFEEIGWRSANPIMTHQRRTRNG